MTGGLDNGTATATVLDRGSASTTTSLGTAGDALRSLHMTSHQPPARRSRYLLRSPGAATALLGVVFLVLFAACTGGGAAPSDDVATLVDPSASPSAAPSASIDPEEAMQAFATCMREHGVDIQVSSAGVGSAGGDKFVSGTTSGPKTGTGTDKGRASLEAAQKACAHLLPQGGVNGPGGKMDPEMEQKLLDFSKCMRDHGIDMPDPKFENGGATVQIGGDSNDGGPQIDPSSQKFKDAQKACESLLPQGEAGGPSTQESKP